MKKVAVLWILIAVIVIAGAILVRGEVLTPSYYGGMGMGLRNDGYCFDDDQYISYEFLYARLSEEDQAIVDAQYLILIADIDFSVLTPEQQQDEIENIKLQLIDFIYEQDFSFYGRP